MSVKEEDTCSILEEDTCSVFSKGGGYMPRLSMSVKEEDTCMPYEEEDTCRPYEEEDTYLPRPSLLSNDRRILFLIWHARILLRI